MAYSNRQRVGKALDLLRLGLTPFVERELKSYYGDVWRSETLKSLPRESDWEKDVHELKLDVHALLVIMWDKWIEVFRQILGHTERSLVSELREIRNRWAHQSAFTADDAYRALDSTSRLLKSVSAPQARDVDAMKQELLRLRYERQVKLETRNKSIEPTKGNPVPGLLPWREIIVPHPDVASGRYQEAEFAADLDQIHRGEGSPEYKDPREFFSRTYITEGLRQLLVNGVLRLSGQGGDPIVGLQTNFGGGKTHSMMALYHLFSDVPVTELPGAEQVLAEADIKELPKVNTAVLVGHALSPGQPLRHIDGRIFINTLWGELAYQIGGEKGFKLVSKADELGVSPGSSALRQLFSKFGPCLILIDEWIAFVRMLYKKHDLPAGSFEANMTFVQALTEAVRQVPNTLLIASIPASDIETGGEGGREALERIQNTFGRMESSWRPASAEEGFEIVRRRLFEPIIDPQKFVARDTVVAAFSNAYREHSQEFPTPCIEKAYEQRMEAAYPIHPELFDRLYGEWSTLERFQRTRGVLRLMAAIINGLWQRNDKNLLIMPGFVPIDDPRISRELMKHLEPNWSAIIEGDVDGHSSLPLGLDGDNANLGRYSAARRVARTIFMGTAPTSSMPNPGIDERSVRLGCVQPGENPAIFGDALRRLTDQATYLYIDRNRYWYSTQPNIVRLARDRADSIMRKPDNIWDEIKKRLRRDRKRGDFSGVHVAPDDGTQVSDDMSARLVILGPEYTHSYKDVGSQALVQAQSILESRSSGIRLYRNMLVFLAPDRTRMVELQQAIAMYLAWDSIIGDIVPLDLNPSQVNQAKTKLQESDSVVNTRINEVYTRVLYPIQHEKSGQMDWQELRLQPSDGALASRVSKRIKGNHLITEYSATSLRIELDRFIWKDKSHVGLKDLWTFFASYPYLPRLKDENVLLEAIQNGIRELTWSDHFAYAEAYDKARKRYLGLKAGQLSSVIMDDRAVLVRPDVALKQIEEDKQRREQQAKPVGDISGAGKGYFEEESKPIESQPSYRPSTPTMKRFYGNINIDPVRMIRDTTRVANEIVQHFTGLTDTEVEISLEISAKSKDGIPERIVHVVSENCDALKFSSYEFENDEK